MDLPDITKKDTKILCTIGPSSLDVKVIEKMYKAGMNAARINTAHGDFKQYKIMIDNIRKVCEIPIIIDIKGPELRVRCKEKRLIAKNNTVVLGFNDKYEIWLNYNIGDKLSKGDKILIHDGRYTFEVISSNKEHVKLKALDNCLIEPNKNANVPNKSLGLPSLTKKDIESINFAKKMNAEFIALSFCRNKEDVLNLRKKLEKTHIKIIAKIENKEGIENIKEIIEYADGIMVARGDLGVEMPLQDVPILQKKIVKECNQKGKLVIVATQMLESMVENPTPTRAEISDIANAILDGADCIMLSEETAMGKYPVEAVSYMSKVALEVEPQIKTDITISLTSEISDGISKSVYELAKTYPITKIICLTSTGFTATKIARFRLDLPIFAITNSEIVKRQLSLYYSLRPICLKEDFWKDPIIKTTKYLYKKKMINKSDLIIFTAGLNTLHSKKTNAIQVHKISELLEYIKKKHRN